MSLATKLILGVVAGNNNPANANIHLAGVAATANEGLFGVTGPNVNVSLTGGIATAAVGSFQNGSSSITTLTLNNISTGTSFAAPFVSYGHPFADSDVPVGGSITATDSNNNPVTVQMDAIATWPSGRVKLAILSHACAETFSASSSKTYTIGSSPTAPNNTPNSGLWGANAAAWVATLAANSDFKVVYGPGFDAGSNTYTTSLNTILANYSQRNPGYGTSYPTGGWELTKVGPVCIEFHGWQYIKNDSTGFFHGYVRCDIWVKAWSPTGPFEVDVQTSMPNMWNTIATSSEKYNQLQGRFATAVQVKNGSTVISYQGGSSDSRVQTLPNANINTTTNTISSASPFFSQAGVSFTSSGTLPGGITANTLYWPSPSRADLTQIYLMKERVYVSTQEANGGSPWAANTQYFANYSMVLNNGIWYYCVTTGTSAASGGPTGTGNSITDGTCVWNCASVDFTSQGTGTITASPMYASFPSCGWACVDILAQPTWVGSGTKPQIYPGHNFTYLTTKSTFTPPYNPAANVMTPNQTAMANYNPLAQLGGAPSWVIGQTGDSPGDQRVGFIPEWSVTSFYLPTSPYLIYSILQESISMLSFSFSFMNDESGGLPFIGNNGTNNSGTPYTGCPSLIPTWNSTNVAGHASPTIAARGATWSGWSSAVSDLSGYLSQYYFGADHMPSLWQIPYLKTGRPIFMEQGVQQGNAASFMAYNSAPSLSGHQYYCIQTPAVQLRALGWGLRCLTQALFICPDNHPIQNYIRDVYDDNAKYQALLTATFPSNQNVFGFFQSETGESSSEGVWAPWQGYFTMISLNMEAWRNGQTPNSKTNGYWTTLMNYYGHQWNLFTTSVNPNASSYISAYRLTYGPTPYDWSNCYTNATTLANQSYANGNVPIAPWPTAPLYIVSGGSSIGLNWYGNPARTALKINTLADPSNTVVSNLLSSFSASIASGTGISGTQGGFNWGYLSGGSVVNGVTFAVW